MRAICLLAVLLVLIRTPLTADTYEVIKITFAGQVSVYSQYVQGKNMRMESSSGEDAQRIATIQNFGQKTFYELDLQAHDYTESQPQGPDLILSLAQWIARPPRVSKSGKTVNVYYETIDTGERKQFFGRTAKHLLVRERYAAEPGACDQTHQTEKDGWYIPASAQRSYLVGAILTGSYMCHDTVVKHGVLSLPGIAVLETNGSMTREIVELSNDPLDKSLFEIPIGFTKVEALPGRPPITWSAHLEMEWAQLGRAFESWFQ